LLIAPLLLPTPAEPSRRLDNAAVAPAIPRRDRIYPQAVRYCIKTRYPRIRRPNYPMLCASRCATTLSRVKAPPYKLGCEISRRALRSVPERFQHCVPQQDRVPLAAFRQLEYSLGDHSHGGVLPVNEAQRVQGIFERGRDGGDFVRREDPTSVKKRPNSHNTNPRTRALLPRQRAGLKQ
jgi:hypothetical protein